MNRNVSYLDIVKSYDRVGQVQVSQSDYDAALAIVNQYGGMAAGAGQACALNTCSEPAVSRSNGCLIPAGFDEICIGPCDVELVETSVCAVAMLAGIYVSPSVACHLSVRNLTVCRWQGFGNCNWIPADFFACCDATAAFDMCSCYMPANSKICMDVRNDSDKKTVKFKGNALVSWCTN